MSQKCMATWMGYDSVNDMNNEHDGLHRKLCDWLGFTSHALRVANSEELTYDEHCLANYEEDAVLHLQRFIQHYRTLSV